LQSWSCNNSLISAFLVLNDLRIPQLEDNRWMIKDDLFQRCTPHIYTTTIEYLLSEGECERMFGNHFESSARLYISSKTFKLPSGRVFQRYLVFCGIPRATPSQVCQGKICFDKSNLPAPHFCPAGLACVACWPTGHIVSTQDLKGCSLAFFSFTLRWQASRKAFLASIFSQSYRLLLPSYLNVRTWEPNRDP